MKQTSMYLNDYVRVYNKNGQPIDLNIVKSVSNNITHYPLKETYSMYGLKSNSDFSQLIGSTILQICIGTFQIQFNIDNDISICAENEVSLQCDLGDCVWQSGDSTIANSFTRLIDKQIIKYEILNESNLILYFSNGDKLELKDCSSHEAYTIVIGSQTYIV